MYPFFADTFYFQANHQHDDKTWSLTDCLSFVVTHECRIAEALTGDHHFVQAGFAAVFA